MKITFFTENTHCGGLDSFLISLINNWPHPEDELIIICNALHPGFEVIRSRLSRSCTVVRHDLPTYSELVIKTQHSFFLRGIRRLFSPLLRHSYFLWNFAALRTVLLRVNPDRLVVVNGGHPGGDTCRAAIISWGIFARHKCRAVYNFHSLATTPRWFERWSENVIDKLVVRYSRAVIGVSRICAESLCKRVGDGVMGKVSWIYNGISAPQPSSADLVSPSLRMELGIAPDSLICLMLATYEPLKGHDFLLRAFQKVIAEVPAAHLLICGYGYPEEIRRVEFLVASYGLARHVSLKGFRRDVDEIFKQSDLLVISSQAAESFGLTSVEAMANRIAIVATRVGGIPEVVEDGEGGVCVNPGDVDGYAEWIVRFLKNPALRKEQGERGYKRYRALFSAERMAKEYAQVIRAGVTSGLQT